MVLKISARVYKRWRDGTNPDGGYKPCRRLRWAIDRYFFFHSGKFTLILDEPVEKIQHPI